MPETAMTRSLSLAFIFFVVATQLSPSSDQSLERRLKRQLYSVAEVGELLGPNGVRFRNGRYEPFLIGDDPSQFKPMPQGARLIVYGHIVGLQDSKKGKLLILSWEESPVLAACRLRPEAVANFQKKHGMWNAAIEGNISEVISSEVVFEPCSISVLLDMHNDPLD